MTEKTDEITSELTDESSDSSYESNINEPSEKVSDSTSNTNNIDNYSSEILSYKKIETNTQDYSNIYSDSHKNIDNTIPNLCMAQIQLKKNKLIFLRI